MKFYKNMVTVLSLGLCASAALASTSDKPAINYPTSELLRGIDRDLTPTPKELLEFSRHPIVGGCLIGKCELTKNSKILGFTADIDPIADYVPPLPYTPRPALPLIERVVLTAYMNKTNDSVLAKFLAIYHLAKAGSANRISSGDDLKHKIIASYFLNRAQDLGSNEKWIVHAIAKLDGQFKKLNESQPGVTLEENHAAHLLFNDAFFDHEYNRHAAQAALLDDYVAHPNNVYTSFLNTAVNNWNGGEAEYDDPELLYNFLISGFFAFRGMDLSKQAELAWMVDPINNKRFRLASIVGGFSAMQRRTLATMHNDRAAIEQIDEEHREWRLINKAFHAFTVGLTFFQEEKNFLEGYNAWEDAFIEGTQRPELITVQDRPRYTFNLEGMFVTRADFSLKLGDLPTAYAYLAVSQLYLPNSAWWDYGRDALQHRQQNAVEIAARYANDNPDDDPSAFMVKKHKWGGPDSVCQVCHQRQSKVWSEEEKQNVLLAPDDILTVGTYPQKRTTWYGAIKNL